ncbi:hypothetical protein IJ670_05465, partial [bacterium]|nr:hypothetical protein [bacterium]
YSKICFSLEEVMKSTNAILIATKPFALDKVLENMFHYFQDHTVLSIVAGAKLEKYRRNLPDVDIARIMPNTPALINQGISAITGDRRALELAKILMQGCGKVIETTEDKMDAITALSGSGPAFYYKIIQTMAQAGEKLGLTKEEAQLLSAQTALGSAGMILENNESIEKLIENVTTPGGCTEVGNEILNNSNIDAILEKTLFETMQKAKSLG